MLREWYAPKTLPDGAVTSADVDLSTFGRLIQHPRMILYTQVKDEDDGRLYYVKGHHKLSRTGVYAVIPVEEAHRDRRTEPNCQAHRSTTAQRVLRNKRGAHSNPNR